MLAWDTSVYACNYLTCILLPIIDGVIRAGQIIGIVVGLIGTIPVVCTIIGCILGIMKYCRDDGGKA